MLSPDIEAVYKRRYEKGYDIFDPAYTKSLQQHHPETSSAGSTTSKTSDPLSRTALSTPSSNQLTSEPGATSQLSTPLSHLTNRISKPSYSGGSSNGSVMSKFSRAQVQEC